jgi:hypothetical protein
MKHDQPLTNEELESMGFEVVTKKDGTFYGERPSFNDIIDQVINNVREDTTWKIKENISESIVRQLDF